MAEIDWDWQAPFESCRFDLFFWETFGRSVHGQKWWTSFSARAFVLQNMGRIELNRPSVQFEAVFEDSDPFEVWIESALPM